MYSKRGSIGTAEAIAMYAHASSLSMPRHGHVSIDALYYLHSARLKTLERVLSQLDDGRELLAVLCALSLSEGSDEETVPSVLDTVAKWHQTATKATDAQGTVFLLQLIYIVRVCAYVFVRITGIPVYNFPAVLSFLKLNAIF